MVFGTKDGNTICNCSPTVINKLMTGDGTVDPDDPTTGSNSTDYIVGPGIPVNPGIDGQYYIDDTTGEIYKWDTSTNTWIDTEANVKTCADSSNGGGGDSDDTSSTFIDAPTAREDAAKIAIIDAEITAIENAISAAVKLNEFETTVSGTTMTDITTGLPYFRVWRAMDPCHPLGYDKREIHYEMYQVMKYFFDLKYVIERKQPSTENNFVWKIYW